MSELSNQKIVGSSSIREIRDRMPLGLNVGESDVATAPRIVRKAGNLFAVYAYDSTIVRYTIDGSEPTASSPEWTYGNAPQSYAQNMTVKAKAFYGEKTPSATIALALVVMDRVATPEVETNGMRVELSTDTEGATIYYKLTDGEFKQYSAPFAIFKDEELTAYATKSGMDDSFKAVTQLTFSAEAIATTVTAIYEDLDEIAGEVEDLQTSQELQDAQLSALANTKADRNGNYPQMIVGTAENLLGKGDGVKQEFTYQTTGGTADVADGIAKYQEVQGNSLVWNQLGRCVYSRTTEYGILYEKVNDITMHLSGTSTGLFYNHLGYQLHCEKDHWYYIAQRFSDTTLQPGIDTLYFYNDSKGLSLGGGFSAVQKSTADHHILLRVASGVVLDTDVTLQLIDLTKMFGAGNEPTTVEEFELLFPLDYYDYNEGEIINFNGTGIKSVGFNAYNHATGKAELLGGNAYQITGTYTSLAYEDVNGDSETITPDTDGIFTPSKNGTLAVEGGSSTDTCVHLVWSGIRNGEYEQYQENTLNLPVAQINTDGTITESAEGKTRLFPDGLCGAGSSTIVKDELTANGAIRRVGKRAYEEGDEADATLTTDGTNTNYPLENPVEVTFSDPLNLTQVVSDFGTQQLLPVNDDEPVTTPFLGKVLYGMNAEGTLRNLPKNYISKETMDTFLSALSTAMSGTWSMTWNDATEKYDFEFTSTPEPEAEE